MRELSPETLPGPGNPSTGHDEQRPTSRVSVVVKAASPSALAGQARQIVRRVDPEVPLQIRTVEEAFDCALAGRRFSLLLIGVFSACALVLATLGVYGLMAYLVSQRTREIGIRLALGAESADVVALIVGRGVRLAVIGVAVGSASALGLTRLLDGMLFGVTATDPIAFASVMAITLTAVLAATWVPARPRDLRSRRSWRCVPTEIPRTRQATDNTRTPGRRAARPCGALSCSAARSSQGRSAS